ncbi:MAG: flippase-like domain-containing protein [Acidobacteria bacterium]|nr:flippase-like domain-containing protein [Acidobacteriota bacterium]
MQKGSLLKSDGGEIAVASAGPAGPSRKNLLFWVHGIAFLLGLALLVYVVYLIGYRTVLDKLQLVGWGIFIIIGLNVARHLIRSLSMYTAVPREFRTVSYWSVVAARLGGEAVGYLTFTGPLGDATKAMLLRKNLPLTRAASAVLIDTILYYVSVIIFILVGMLVLLSKYGSKGAGVNNVLIAVAVGSFIILGALIATVRFRLTPVSRFLSFLAGHHLLPKFISQRLEDVRSVETNVFQFYNDRKRDFLVVFTLALLVHFVSVTEVLAGLRLLEVDYSWGNSFIIEGLTKVINLIFSFVPGTVGVYEGGNEAILTWLGYTAAIGVSLALIRRGGILFSIFIGMVVLLWRGVTRSARELTHEDPDQL